MLPLIKKCKEMNHACSRKITYLKKIVYVNYKKNPNKTTNLRNKQTNKKEEEYNKKTIPNLKNAL